MKGISPMIAVVLLIAFTVAVGGILSTWLSTLATTQTSTVSSQTEKQVKCSAVNLLIKEVRYNSTTPCAICNVSIYVNTTVKYESGTATLGPNISMEVIYKGERNTSIAITTLTPGESFANFTNVTRWSVSQGIGEAVVPEIVRVRTFCQTNVPIVAECKSGEPCMVAT